MRFNTLSLVGTLVCVIAIILSIIGLFMSNIYVQAWLVLSIAMLLATGWVIRMIEIFKK